MRYKLSEQINYLKRNPKIVILYIILSLIIFVIPIYKIRTLDQIVIINDEFGYWASAESIAGKDWSSLIQYTPYYNVGYSLLLVPFTFIIKAPNDLYKVAICMNLLFLLASFYCSVWCSRQLFTKQNIFAQIFIGFAVTIYSNNIFQAQFTWPENLLYFLYWVLFACFISLEKCPKKYKYILAVFIVFCMYIVHQRTIPIVIVTILCLIYMTLRQKRTLKSIMLIIVSISICVAITLILKEWHTNNIWAESYYAQTNNPDGRTMFNMISAAFIKIKQLLYAFGGRLFYFGISGGPIIFMGLFSCIRKVVCEIHHNVKHSNIRENSFLCTYVWLFCSFMGVMGVGCIMGINPNRADVVVYGRYIENAIGPFLLLGFYYLFEERKNIRYIPYYIGAMVVLAALVRHIISFIEDKSFNVLCSVGLGGFFTTSSDYNEAIIKATIAAILFTVLISVFLLCYKKKCIFGGVILACFVLYWISQSIYSQDIMYQSRERIYQNYEQGIMWALNENPNSDIYYVLDKDINEYAKNAKLLQFMIPNRSIKVVEKENFNENILKSGSIILMESKMYYEGSLGLCAESEFLNVYLK